MHRVFDREGHYLATVSTDYIDKATRRGEVAQTDDGVYIMIGTGYWNDLTQEERYKIHKAKERAKR